MTNLISKVHTVGRLLNKHLIDEAHIVAITIDSGDPSMLMQPEAFCGMVFTENLRHAVKYSQAADDSHHFCLTIDGVRVAVCCIDDAELAETPLQSCVEESHNVS